jgi:Tfp pilus assembly protein PilV
MKIINFKKGFTIIETLVAVTILMLAIVGPMTVSQKSLVASIYAKDQVIATYLAQDAMEYLKNKRDTYISNSSFANWVTTYGVCTSANLCSIDTFMDRFDAPCVNSCRLYDRGTRYTPDSASAEPTIFYRSFYIDSSAAATSNANNEVKVVVRVWWQNSSNPSETLLETQFFNVVR